jgi:hypothetical protein
MAFKYVSRVPFFTYLSFEVLFVYLLFMSLCEVTMSPDLFLRTTDI